MSDPGESCQARSRSGLTVGACRGVFELEDGLIVDQLGVIEDLVEAQDRSAGHVLGEHSLQQILGREPELGFLDFFAEGLGVLLLIPRCHGVKARVIDPFGMAKGSEETVEFGVCGDEIDQVSILGFAEAIGFVEGSSAGLIIAREGVGEHPIGPEECEGRIDHGDLDVLTSLASFPGKESRTDGLGGGTRTRFIGHDVADQIADGQLGVDLDGGVTRQALDDRVVDPSLTVGAVGAIARDRAIDQFRIEGSQARLIEPEAPSRSGSPVLHKHVGLPDEFQDNLEAFLPGEIQGDGSFVPVAVCVEGSESTTGERREAQDLSGNQGFDLDHLGSLVGQHHGTEWAGYHG